MKSELISPRGTATVKHPLDSAPPLERGRLPLWQWARVIWTAFWRTLLHWRFRLLQRHRHDRVVVEQVAGKPIVVLPQVMNPVLFLTGEFLVSLLAPLRFATGPDIGQKPPKNVLDMGCGTGIGAIFAAGIAQHVVAVDLNPTAVRCTRMNVLLHQLEEVVEVREGDLFNPVHGERFDLILFNPPYLPGQPRTEFERALWSTDVIERFAAGLGDHLAENGVALVLFSSIADHAKHLERFRAFGFRVEIAARRNLLTEVLTVYRLSVDRLSGE